MKKTAENSWIDISCIDANDIGAFQIVGKYKEMCEILVVWYCYVL